MSSEAGGGMLRAYRALASLATPLAPLALRLRLARGKEHPQRWKEKLGQTQSERPDGRLAWMHAVGMGEVLALRGLIDAMARRDGDLSFLVTSMSKDSALPFSRNLPPRTTHQFLPLDCPRFVDSFLTRWRPDLSVWSEQDIWPCFVKETSARGVPLAYVSARIGARSFEKRLWARSLYAGVLSRFDLIVAQESESARHLVELGATGSVGTVGPLKASCPPLADDEQLRAKIVEAVGKRFVWLAASTHEDDETVALDAHARLRKDDAQALLILAPREPRRGEEIQERCKRMGLAACLRTKAMPALEHAVLVADSFGEMGTWYRVAPVTLMGGTFGSIGGHNPWEPALLGSAVLRGPSDSSFRPDFAAFEEASAALRVDTAEDVTEALVDPGLDQVRDNARKLAAEAARETEELADGLLGLMD